MSTDKIGITENIFGRSLRRIRKEMDVTQGEFAKHLSISSSYVSDLEKGKAMPSEAVLKEMVEYYRINRIYLETGEGEMFAPIKIDMSLTGANIKKAMEMIAGAKELEEDCQRIDIFNMVDAGSGTEPDWHEPIDTRIIPTHLLKNGVRAVLVRGRSMEPTFKNGAVIGVQETDKSVIEGEAYAVVLPYSGASVKRLYPVPDGVIIRSDNKEFPEVKLMRGDIPDYFILGRVCWVVQEV